MFLQKKKYYGNTTIISDEKYYVLIVLVMHLAVKTLELTETYYTVKTLTVQQPTVKQL